MATFQSRNLRKGRRSIQGHCYLITIVTRQRHPWFHEFGPACIASRVFYAEAVNHHAKTLAYVVMPDHVHWLLELDGDLASAVRLYKAKVSSELGDRIWQRGYHDRAIRTEDNLRDTARYLVANPLRAGLVDNIRDYSFWNAAWL